MSLPSPCILSSLSLSQKVSAFFCLSLSLSLFLFHRHLQRLSLAKVMEDDWDLHAVVRGCATVTSSSTSSSSAVTATTTTTTTSVSSSSFGFPMFVVGSEKAGQVSSLSDLDPFEVRTSIEELHELCKPFFPKSKPPASSSSSSQASPLSYSSSAPKSLQKQPTNKLSLTSTPRSKRR